MNENAYPGNTIRYNIIGTITRINKRKDAYLKQPNEKFNWLMLA